MPAPGDQRAELVAPRVTGGRLVLSAPSGLRREGQERLPEARRPHARNLTRIARIAQPNPGNLTQKYAFSSGPLGHQHNTYDRLQGLPQTDPHRRVHVTLGDRKTL